MEIGTKFVEAEKLDASKVTSRELTMLPTVLAGEYSTELSVYTDINGNKAVVLPGWTVSGAKSENIIWGKDQGLVIYQIPEEKVSTTEWEWTDSNELEKLKETYDQLVWVPVSLLEPNGTLDGVNFNEKFGRRNYDKNEFSKNEYHEDLVGDLVLEKESIDKYGGYYFSRYHISQDEKTKKPRAVKDAYPWVKIDGPTSEKVAKTFIQEENVNTHLRYGAEYDTVLEWAIESGTRTYKDIVENPISKVIKTGSIEKYCNMNNICDFEGNLEEWTQEFHGTSSGWRVTRGHTYCVRGFSMARRKYVHETYESDNHGFRVAVYIK